MDRTRTASLLLPPTTGVLEIDIDESAQADASFSILDKLIGKCDADCEFRVQGELLEQFRQHAARQGSSIGARLRYLMARDLFGDEGVESMVSQALTRNRAPARDPIPAHVRAKG